MSSQVRLVPHLVPVCDVYPGEAPPPQRPKQRFRPYLCTDSVLQVDAKQAGPVACLMRWTTTLPRIARALTQSQRAFATCALEYVVSKPTIADLIHSQNAAGARDAAQAYLEDNASKDPGYRKVYEAFSAARTEQRTWFGTAERAYHQFVTS